MLADPTGDGGIDPETLEPFVERLLAAAGAPEDVAAPVAASLVLADLRGHNSHGSRRIPTYVQSMAGEREEVYHIDASARPEVVSKGATHAVVDGRFAFGQVVGREATDLAVEKAGENGVAMVGLRDATHLGRIGEWSERAADAGMLFAAFVNAQGGQLIAPPGSADRRYTTNPVSFGIPTFDALDFPVMLDIATSQVAGGKVAEFAAKGTPLHEEWTVTDDGGSVTDATAVLEGGEGAVLPFGGRVSGYKGFGLAMVAELFAAIAGDGLTVADTDYLRGNAAMFVAADPTVFTTRETVEDRVTALRDYIAETEFSENVPTGPVAYGDRALLPGEPEHLVERDRREHGVPLPPRDVADLCDVAEAHGVADAVPAAFAVDGADD